ncbi:MAG: exonuclease subunit SbcD [Pseudoxanthomonas sp.]
MRLLHTSDWHLGQSFFGYTRQREHDEFLSWLAEAAKGHDVDAIVIAGDLFDVSMPPSFAREQFNSFIDQLCGSGMTLVVLGGNHDSPATLREGRQLLSRLSTLVIPEISTDPSEQVFVINRKSGEPGLLLCGLPFIRPRDVVRSAPGQSDEEKKRAVMDGIADYYAATHSAARALRTKMNLSLPIVATGHLTTLGASSSASVREIYVGSLSAFPTDHFPPADYIALGHIHRPQVVGGQEHIRYSGSPIHLSFDEVGQEKNVVLVDFEGGSLKSITPVPVPAFHPMQRLAGAIDELPDLLKAAADGHVHERPLWLEITATDAGYLPDLMARVDQMTASLPLEVLSLVRKRNADAGDSLASQPQTLAELSVDEVFEQVLAGNGNIPPERLDTVRALFAAIAAEVVEGEQA